MGMRQTAQVIAALFVHPKGPYSELEGVDLWPLERDARLYAGPHPVVAHPPCTRWCRLAGLIEHRYGHKKGDDGGCFAAALKAVRTYGGVLEHPAFSDAWKAFGLNLPPTKGGWVNADFEGGWTCYVEQARYGHPAKKATYLYACKVDLPEMRWGYSKGSGVWVSWLSNNMRRSGPKKRLKQRRASATPTEFRDLLVAMAKSANRSKTPRPLDSCPGELATIPRARAKRRRA